MSVTWKFDWTSWFYGCLLYRCINLLQMFLCWLNKNYLQFSVQGHFTAKSHKEVNVWFYPSDYLWCIGRLYSCMDQTSPENFENLRGKKPLVHIYKVFRVWEVLVVWQLNYNVLWLLFAVTWYLITASLNYHTISFFLHLSNIAKIINDKRPLNQANWNYMYVNKETEVSSL